MAALAGILPAAWLLAWIAFPAVPGMAGETLQPSSVTAPSPSSTAIADPFDTDRLTDLPGLKNVGRVAPGIYRGAQPKGEGYATLRKLGIRTVINLRNKNERKAVESAGMRLVHIPMDQKRGVETHALRWALSAMADPANQPVYVHCAAGKDRTGLVVAVYRMETEGWSARKAEDEMQSYGFHDRWDRYLDFVRRYPGRN